MSSFKYSRLPTSEAAQEFRALDGPSYFTYGPSGVDNSKYKSAFTYSTLNVESQHEEVPGLLASFQTHFSILYCHYTANLFLTRPIS